MPHGAYVASDEDASDEDASDENSFIASENGGDDDCHLYRSLDQNEPLAQPWGNIDEAEVWDDESMQQFIEKTKKSRPLQLVGGLSQHCLDYFRVKPLSVTEYRSQ